MTDKELIARAAAARDNAYAPYSKFNVGAAILCADGSVYSGCNFESAAFGAGVCAERVALGAAVAAGNREIVRIAVISSGEDYCMPCGVCRQSLYEFSQSLELLCAKRGGEYITLTIKDLLPYGFSGF